MRGDLGRVKLRNVWEMLKRMLLEMLNQVQHDRWMRVQKMLNQVQHDKIPVTLNLIQGLHDREKIKELSLKSFNGFYSHGKGYLIMGKLIHPRIIFVIFVEWFLKIPLKRGLYLE